MAVSPCTTPAANEEPRRKQAAGHYRKVPQRMTAKQFDLNHRGDQIKKDGWFSWRHRTREAHDEAVLRYGGSRSESQARKRAEAETRNARTPFERTRAFRRQQVSA